MPPGASPDAPPAAGAAALVGAVVGAGAGGPGHLCSCEGHPPWPLCSCAERLCRTGVQTSWSTVGSDSSSSSS